MKQRRARRQFSEKFKIEIIEKIKSGQITVAQAAADHDLTATQIYQWKRQLRDKQLDVAVDSAPRVQHSGVNPKYVRHLEEKLREANEKLGELYLAVDCLKKVHGDPGRTKNANSFIVTDTSWARLKRRAK